MAALTRGFGSTLTAIGGDGNVAEGGGPT